VVSDPVFVGSFLNQRLVSKQNIPYPYEAENETQKGYDSHTVAKTNWSENS
jgi:hypothetical protein